MKIENIVGDKEKQECGAWVKYPDDDGEFLLAYARKGKPRRFYDTRLNKFRKSPNQFISVEKLNEITLEMVVEHIVLDWKNLDSADPNDPAKRIQFPYSKENCRMLMEASPDLLDWIAESCRNIENFGGKKGSDEDEEDPARAATKSSPAVEPQAR